MAGLTRFDVAEHRGVAMVVIESNLLPPDPALDAEPFPDGWGWPLRIDHPQVHRR